MPKGIQEHRDTSGLRPLNTRTAEERKAIQSKGGKASQQKRRMQLQAQEIARAVLAMGIHKGRVVEADSGISFDEAIEANVSVATYIFVQEVKKYFETGDIEARNFIFSKAYPENICSPGNVKADIESEADADTIKIHLIRGEKPKEEKAEESTATPSDAEKLE